MNYTSRDVQSNIENLIEDAKAVTTLWQPGSESDPGIVLLKALAAEVDLLSFNLDTQVDEMYMQSATQIKSIRRLGVANGYVPRWYRAPRVKVKLTNTSEDTAIQFDFSLPRAVNNICFATTNALGDLTSIPYFIIPNGPIGQSDKPTVYPKGSTNVLGPTDYIYRYAAQGILKSVIINPLMMNSGHKAVNSLSYRLPAQNVDSELIWVEEITGTLDNAGDTIWEYESGSSFIDSTVETPKYQIAVDDYNNLVVVFNRAINNTMQKKNLIKVYYLETYGTVGEIAHNVLQVQGLDSEVKKVLSVTHPGNTVDMPDGSALTGRAPMTASEAAADAKNWVNTNDSIITLKNFTAWINRQEGISVGVAVDCQKALELNWAVRFDADMDPALKPLKYIVPGDLTKGDDFPANLDRSGSLIDPIEDSELDFPHEFLTYKLMYYAVFNNFMTTWNNGEGTIVCSEWDEEEPTVDKPYRRYRPSRDIRRMLQKEYRPTQNLTCSIDFGYVRVFEWSVNGVIWTKSPIDKSDEESIVNTVMNALRLRFNAKNMKLGELPKMMDVVDTVQNADSRIRYFDAGLLNLPMIEWSSVRDYTHRTPNSSIKCNPDYFNYISIARFIDGDTEHISNANRISKISVARECIKSEVR